MLNIPLPGPSHQSSLSPTQTTSAQSFQCSSSSLCGQGIIRNEENEDSDDDNVEIVAEDKPWRERSPVVLSSSDSEAGNEVEHEIELLNQNSNISSPVDSHISVDTSQEVFPIFQQSTVEAGSSEYDMAELAQSDEQTDTAEITVTDLISCSDRSSKNSSHYSKHHHKRAKKHKHSHSHHRDRSHHQKHLHEPSSCTSNRYKKHEHRSEKLKTSDSSVADIEKKNKLSSSANNTYRSSNNLDNQAWMSDDSSDSTDHQPLRSVVVVPHTFKKNSTGHKRSRDCS